MCRGSGLYKFLSDYRMTLLHEALGIECGGVCLSGISVDARLWEYCTFHNFRE